MIASAMNAGRSMLRSWRRRQFERAGVGGIGRWALKIWAALAKTPKLYRMISTLSIAGLSLFDQGRGKFRRLPFAAGWTQTRDFPAPTGDSFVSQWHKGSRGVASDDWLRGRSK